MATSTSTWSELVEEARSSVETLCSNCADGVGICEDLTIDNCTFKNFGDYYNGVQALLSDQTILHGIIENALYPDPGPPVCVTWLWVLSFIEWVDNMTCTCDDSVLRSSPNSVQIEKYDGGGINLSRQTMKWKWIDDLPNTALECASLPYNYCASVDTCNDDSIPIVFSWYGNADRYRLLQIWRPHSEYVPGDSCLSNFLYAGVLPYYSKYVDDWNEDGLGWTPDITVPQEFVNTVEGGNPFNDQVYYDSGVITTKTKTIDVKVDLDQSPNRCCHWMVMAQCGEDPWVYSKIWTFLLNKYHDGGEGFKGEPTVQYSCRDSLYPNQIITFRVNNCVSFVSFSKKTNRGEYIPISTYSIPVGYDGSYDLTYSVEVGPNSSGSILIMPDSDIRMITDGGAVIFTPEFEVAWICENHPSICTVDLNTAGGDNGFDQIYAVPESWYLTGGDISIDVEMYYIKDRLILTTNKGVTIYDSGCISGRIVTTASIPAESLTLRVQILPNCAGGTWGTAWLLKINCISPLGSPLGSTAGSPLGSPLGSTAGSTIDYPLSDRFKSNSAGSSVVLGDNKHNKGIVALSKNYKNIQIKKCRSCGKSKNNFKKLLKRTKTDENGLRSNK